MTTKLNWSAMSARERDLLVAEQVIGLNRLNARQGLINPETGHPEPQYHWSSVLGHDFAPPYTRDIASAFTVVEKLRAEGFSFNLDDRGDPDAKEMWRATFWKELEDEACELIVGESDNPAESICLAALRAKQIDV